MPLEQHTHYGIQVNTTKVGGIIRQDVNLETDVRTEVTDGMVNASLAHVVSQRPSATFATRAIKAMIDLLNTLGGAGGESFGMPLATPNVLNVYAQKAKAGGTREGATSHRKYNLTNGILVPDTLDVAHRGDAELMMRGIPIYDGTTDPITWADAQTLPTGITDAQRYTIGPVQIAGVTISGVRRISLNWGLTISSEGEGGEIWDRTISIGDAMPTLTISGIDTKALTAATGIELLGKQAAHADTIVYLRKRTDPVGSFVADGTAEHVKITAAGLAYITTPFSSDGRIPATCDLMLTMHHDGTNLPFVFDVDSIIT